MLAGVALHCNSDRQGYWELHNADGMSRGLSLSSFLVDMEIGIVFKIIENSLP